MLNIRTRIAHLRIQPRDTSLVALAPRTVERNFLRILGAGLVAFGVFGFVPSLAPNGHLLGIFAVDTPQNALHLLTGAAALAIARMPKRIHAWYGAATISIFYGLLTILGFAQRGTTLGLMRVNAASSLLHLLIAVTALAAIAVAEYGRMSHSLATLKSLLGITTHSNRKSDKPPTSSRRNATA